MERESEGEFFGITLDNGSTDGESACDETIFTDSAFDLASPVWRRLIGDDANHAARGIGTERAGLWAAQHFDLLHVE